LTLISDSVNAAWPLSSRIECSWDGNAIGIESFVNWVFSGWDVCS
jgi:hypothetical protein